MEYDKNVLELQETSLSTYTTNPLASLPITHMTAALGLLPSVWSRDEWEQAGALLYGENKFCRQDVINFCRCNMTVNELICFEKSSVIKLLMSKEGYSFNFVLYIMWRLWNCYSIANLVQYIDFQFLLIMLQYMFSLY